MTEITKVVSSQKPLTFTFSVLLVLSARLEDMCSNVIRLPEEKS